MGKNELDEIEKILKIVLKGNNDNISSGDISDVINQLHELKRQVVRKEEVERKRQEEERRRQEEQQRLEEEKRLAEEHVKEITSMDLPMGWNNLFLDDERSRGIHVDSIADGLILSLRNLGCVDIEYISAITGEDYKAVISALKGSIYQNPNSWGECFFKGWETAEEYLSGNLMNKWGVAKAANREYDGYFSDNIRALEKVMPPTVAREDVYITLGSPWVPSDIIDDFITHLFGSVPFAFAEGRFLEKEDLRVKHDLETGSWEIPGKGRYNHSVGVKNTYGTERLEALYILEKTLNMKSVAVYDEIKDYTKESGKRKVINQQETIAALEKQKKLVDKFQEWVWLDRVRKERLMVIFEAQYSCARKRTFDGAFLEFSTMSPKIALYTYQKNAVARILFSPNTLLAHDVGSGKTYVMIAAGMELRRMGLSKKHMYVVPNNLIGQWKNIFLNMYPQAKLLTVEPRDLKPEKRDSVLEKIRDEDFDGIIMAYSCFEKIPISREYYKTELEEKKKRLMAIVKEPSCATSKLKRKTDSITESISNLILSIEDAYDGIYFDELGINQLFIDEAHNFKNVPIDTQIDKVLGINKTGSKKCQDMMDKVHVVQRQNGGGGVVMATGTPITNSITDIFVFQKYLQDGELAMMDLQHFDSWVGMFAEKATGFEVDVDTSNFRIATRFSKFHNLPELTTMISNFADFHSVDKNAGIPDFDGYADAVISKTPEFADYLKDISDRTEAVRNGDVSRKDDNMLKITTDGRKAALDYRLVNPKATFSYQSKVARCVENVANIYRMTGAEKSAQLIFCDTSTPKPGFNLYDEIKRLLQIYGIPEETIAFVHSAETEKKREELFSKVRSGAVRILLGSTFKLGLGVNVQDKLIALHHLDVPWRPADMVQREGRILRQGNSNEKIKIYRYITEGSFDAYSWQLLETKQRFISELLAGSVTERSGSDIEDTVLNYAEVKALAVGNPLIKERVEVANELSRYSILQRKLVETRINLQKELEELPGKIQYSENRITWAKDDSCHYAENKKVFEREERKILREKIHNAVAENEFAISETVLMEYQGFQMILPANMKKEKPYVWLKRKGKYYVELGDTEIGDLVRIDNFFEGFDKYIDKEELHLSKLMERKNDIKSELARKESYTDKIEDLRLKLEQIDKELGVEKS